MARFRGSRLGTQVHSVKHVLDTNGVLAAGAKTIVPLSKVVNARTEPFDPVELVVGENVNGIYLTVYALGASGAGQDGSINWYFAKARTGQDTTADFPTAGLTGTSEIRSQILHQEKGIAGSADGTPMVFKGVIVIPRGMRRQRAGDQYFVSLFNTDATNNVNFCLQAIYKSFS